ncbi:MAG TPA: transaldolase [Paenalcaligenes sp.]|nr:transaldolase [Paenalcaligenes sp.]
MTKSLLDSLRDVTTVVADTGDVAAIKQYRPTDATTNPSLVLNTLAKDEYKPLLEQVIRDHPQASLNELSDRLIVALGRDILALIPGRVSTEVDARLSFDTQATIERARHIIQRYEDHNIERERVLIKIAATWEGIEAARQLQAEGINCNLTLLFSLPQAVACAHAKVTLISPFVGRIYDWYKHNAGDQWDEAAHAGPNDPGVQSVERIYNYYKIYDIDTEIMGASFRNSGQVLALAGCDLLTISPALLAELEAQNGTVEARLNPERAKNSQAPWMPNNEVVFRTELNNDAMATEKLAEGIRLFIQDSKRLDELIQKAQNN